MACRGSGVPSTAQVRVRLASSVGGGGGGEAAARPAAKPERAMPNCPSLVARVGAICWPRRVRERQARPSLA